MNPAEIFAINKKAKELQKELTQTQASYREELKHYIFDYFKGNIPNVLALSKNQFITGINERSFELQSGDAGIYWIATGYLATVKDGSITHGHSLKTLYQGEYEVMPKELKLHTLEAAKELTKPIFPVVARVYHGADFANIGYELARSEDLGVMLVWRKAATAYIDRSTGSVSSEAELQLLPLSRFSLKPEVRENMLTLEKNTQNEEVKNWMHLMLSNHVSVAIHRGGRLKKELILKYTHGINEIFGMGTVSNIVTNIEKQSSRKKLTDENKSKKVKQPKEEQTTVSSEIDFSSVEYKGLKL